MEMEMQNSNNFLDKKKKSINWEKHINELINEIELVELKNDCIKEIHVFDELNVLKNEKLLNILRIIRKIRMNVGITF